MHATDNNKASLWRFMSLARSNSCGGVGGGLFVWEDIGAAKFIVALDLHNTGLSIQVSSHFDKKYI